MMNNNCKRYQEQCSLYLEDELAAHDRQAFEAHLQHCPLCQHTMMRLRALRLNLKNISRIAPSRDFETILRARIQMTKQIGQSPWASIFQRFKVPAYALSMAVITAAVFFFYFGSFPNEIEGISIRSFSFFPSPVEAQIQPGDIVYPVDVLSSPREMVTIKIPQDQKATISRSMLLAPSRGVVDTTSAPETGAGLKRPPNFPVSF